MSEAPKYFKGEGFAGRAARKHPVSILSPDVTVGMRVTVRQGPGIAPVIRPGLLCYSATQPVRGAASTFIATPDGDLTIDHANDVEYAYDFTVGNDPGQIPTDTVAAIAICYILNASEPMFLEMGGEPISLIIGPRIKRTEELTADHGLILEEIIFPGEDGVSSLVSFRKAMENTAVLITDARTILYGDASANPPIPTLDGRITTAIQTEVDPDGQGITGQLLTALKLAALGDGQTEPTLAVDYRAYVDGELDLAGNSATATLLNSLKAAALGDGTNPPTLASTTEVTTAIANADYATLAQIGAYDAVFGANASNALNLIDLRADSRVSASTVIQKLVSEFGAGAAGLTTFRQTVADLEGSAARIDVTGTGGGGSFSYGGFTDENGQAFYAKVDSLVDATGAAVWALTANGVEQNVPLTIINGGNGAWTRHINGAMQTVTGAGFGANGDLEYWRGPSNIAVSAMTLANSTSLATGTGSTNPYIGGSVYVPGSFAFSRTESGRYSAANNHQSPVVNYTTQGNEITVRAVLRVISERYYTPAVAANVVPGKSYPGSAALNIELAQAGGAYAEYYVGPQISGEMDTIWAAGPDPNHVDGSGDAFTQRVKETYTIEKEVSVTVAAAVIAAGTLLQWRATIDGWTSVPSGHTPQTYLEISVSENG